MIAWAGIEQYRDGHVDGLDLSARPRWPLDEQTALDDPTHKPGRKGAKA
jgi:N6-L-threonylcarbamoyladenine synthase